MISLWTRVLSSANGSATTDVRSVSSCASGSLGSVVATWIRECSDIDYFTPRRFFLASAMTR